MTKHYVEYTYAGCFCSESSVKEIKSRGQKINLPDGAYAYHIFDREEVVQNGEKLTGKPKNYSPRHIKGEVYNMERVEREVKDNSILLFNMKNNKWRKVIRCRQGFIPIEKGDVFINL
jgi:hypothetical protein